MKRNDITHPGEGKLEQNTDIQRFVQENREWLAKLLAYGDDEARGYVLALLANGGNSSDIERVQRELQNIKEDITD